MSGRTRPANGRNGQPPDWGPLTEESQRLLESFLLDLDPDTRAIIRADAAMRPGEPTFARLSALWDLLIIVVRLHTHRIEARRSPANENRRAN